MEGNINYNMVQLSHEVKTGETENGEKTYATPVNIIGRIEKNKRLNIFMENEDRKFFDILFVSELYTVNTGDRVNGKEVTQDLDKGKFILE